MNAANVRQGGWMTKRTFLFSNRYEWLTHGGRREIEHIRHTDKCEADLSRQEKLAHAHRTKLQLGLVVDLACKHAESAAAYTH
jgi:hypothetical protein